MRNKKSVTRTMELFYEQHQATSVKLLCPKQLPKTAVKIDNAAAAFIALYALWDEQAIGREPICAALFLNAEHKPIGFQEVKYKPHQQAPTFEPFTVLGGAAYFNAKYVILAFSTEDSIFNHSSKDVKMLRRIAADVEHALVLMDITLLDVLFIEKFDYVSLAENGWLRMGSEARSCYLN